MAWGIGVFEGSVDSGNILSVFIVLCGVAVMAGVIGEGIVGNDVSVSGGPLARIESGPPPQTTLTHMECDLGR